MNSAGDLSLLTTKIRPIIKEQGWAWVPDFQAEDDGGSRLLGLATAFGEICVMGHAGSALIETGCDQEAPAWEPFNRPEAIGWHNDFSTWNERPLLSFAWIRSIPTDDDNRGDWRVVSCRDIIASLEATAVGRRSLSFLRKNALPFKFAPDEPMVRFHVLNSTLNDEARFYGRALRLGLAEEPNQQALEAIEIWEQAANISGRRLPAQPGALLICDNWRSMHDRMNQAPGRRSSLLFVNDEKMSS